MTKDANSGDTTSSEGFGIMGGVERDLLQQVVQPRSILLVEDNAARSGRRIAPGAKMSGRREISIRLHLIGEGKPRLLTERHYLPGTLSGLAGRSAVAIDLIDASMAAPDQVIVAAGTTYGASRHFRDALVARRYCWTVELPPSTEVFPARGYRWWAGPAGSAVAKDLLKYAHWEPLAVRHPSTGQTLSFLCASFGEVETANGGSGYLFIIQTGTVRKLQRGTIFALCSDADLTPREIVESVAWTRWIRPLVRKDERRVLTATPTGREANGGSNRSGVRYQVRVNIKHSRESDAAESWNQLPQDSTPRAPGAVFDDAAVINVAELFAGAGGMGLGFLLAAAPGRKYRVVTSAEIHPVYTQTLQWNHREFARRHGTEGCERIPNQVKPLDLTEDSALDAVRETCRSAGDLHVMIGGPPCQGFSNANRNSWHSSNPNNRLIETYLRYVKALRPRIFLMENVQGIVWTPRNGEPHAVSVAEGFVEQAAAAGYLVFPKALDAVWYGVPQHRSRFFILGISKDLGYLPSDFGSWGPFPKPTHGPGTGKDWVTVDQAIGDLPSISNGSSLAQLSYRENPEAVASNEYLRAMRQGADRDTIWDHVTSRHAGYVIERYSHIKPGENWESIRGMFTNYADVSRTHSNIYRRLEGGAPSITIGHYRKAMLIHPEEDRGLSLREAARLQSFPDWFRFMGKAQIGDDLETGGLTHKQQQLANAVCPLVTKAIAEYIAGL